MTGRGGCGSVTIDSLADVLEQRAKYFRVLLTEFELCCLHRTERAVALVPAALQNELQHAITGEIGAALQIFVVAVFVIRLAVLHLRSESIGKVGIGDTSGMTEA